MGRQVLAFSLVLVVGILIGVGMVVGTGDRNSALAPESPFTVFNRAYTKITDELIAKLTADNTIAGVEAALEILKQQKPDLDKQVALLRTLNPSDYGKDLEGFMNNNTANRNRLRKFLDANKELAKAVKKDSKLKAKVDELLTTYSTIMN